MALVASLGGPGVAAIPKAPNPRTLSLYRLEWTRALNAREVSWIRAKVFWAYWLRKTFCQFVVSSCLWSCLLLSCLHLYLLALASLLLCPLVSYAGPPLGLFWASPGALLGPILGLRRAILGLLAAPGAPGPSWASSRLLLGSSLAGPGSRTLGSLLAALGPLLARPWAAPGHSGAVLAASWASFGASWAALGRRKRVFTKPCKNHGFCMVFA